MYILELCQGEVSHEIGLFHTIEDGRKLISQLDGYKYEVIEEFEYEYFVRIRYQIIVHLNIMVIIVLFLTFWFLVNGK